MGQCEIVEQSFAHAVVAEGAAIKAVMWPPRRGATKVLVSFRFGRDLIAEFLMSDMDYAARLVSAINEAAPQALPNPSEAA